MTATFYADAPTLTGGGLVVSYERVSRFQAQNVDATITRGVSRQAEDAEDLGAARGLGPIVHLDGDEGVSASRFETRERKDWTRLLGMVRRGEVAVVLVWSLDRIIRQTRELDDLLEACRATGAVIIQTLTGTTINPEDPESVAMAKIQGVLAETEVAKMAKRAKRKQAALAKDGRPHGGTRVFGYRDATFTKVQEDEAAAARTVATRVLNGASLGSCARWLNAEGFTGTRGAKWTGTNLAKYLARPSLAGIRVHHGVQTPGVWPPLFAMGTHRALVSLLSDADLATDPDPDRKPRRTTQTTEATHLLTGIATCGVCGGGVSIKGGTIRAYRCNRTGCHGVQRAQVKVDAMVEAWVVEKLSRTNNRGALVDDTASVELANATAAVKALAKRRKAQVQHQAVTGALSEDDYADTLAAMDQESARLTAVAYALEASMAAPERVLDGVTGPTPTHKWEDLDMVRKRAIIRIMCTVRLDKAVRRGAKFDRGSVTITPTRG